MTRTEHELLRGLSDDDALGLESLGSRQTLTTGAVLFRLGGTAEALFLIEHGRIALTLPMQVLDQEQNVLVEERGVGQALGWSAIVPPHRFTLTATALVETQVLALPREALFAHFETRPDVGYVVTRNVAAVTAQRLQVLQTMWLREMQRVVKLSYA
jgi:CRP-like cAMP-binding protein